MNETAIVYIVHSDLDENNIFAMFEDEVEAIMYARRHKEELTYVDKTEMSLDESGDYDEVLSAETIWVYDEEDELTDEEIEELIQADEDRKWAEADLGDTTWFEDLDTDSLVETLEENEDIVECKECFELFPKQDCFKIAIGYICPECGKIHSHEEPEFEIDSIPDVVIADEDTFKIDFPEVERMNYGNDMIPDEPTPEVENDPILEPECVGPECEAPVEAPVTKDETITKLVIDEHEAIDGYEKAKIEIEANSELDEKEKEEILDTIEHIKEEEIEHIEELEELVDEVEETKADEPAEESKPEETEEPEILTEGALTETIADIFSGIGNFFQKGVNAVKDFFVSGWNAVGGSKFALDDFYSPEGKYNTNKEHGNGYTVYGYNDKKEKVQQQKFNKLGKAYEYAVELSKALGKTALSVIEITDYKDEGKPILAIFKDGDVTDKTKDIILNKANTLSKELTQLDRQKAHQKKADELKNAETKKEEPKDDKKPDQETQTTYKYKADPITVTVEGKKPIIVKSNDDLNTRANIKKCEVTANKDGIVNLIAPSKNKGWFVEGLKPGKVTLTVKLGDTTICKCEVIVKQKPLSPEDEEKIKAAKELLKKQGYKVEDPVTESLEEHVNEEHPAIESDQKLVGTDNAVVSCKVNKVISHSEDEKPVDCKGEKKPLKKPLTEITHAQYAKPEGNRVQAFNNALKYAKKENKPFIYGYTNHTGKFFAAEQPMKVTGSPAEAEKEFRQQYKNCKVVYVVYPDKEFIREGLFTKAEQEEYNMDEEGYSLDSHDQYVRCGFCDEIYTKSECKYERNLGWLCPRCEAAIYSRGEKLTFVDPDEFLEN